MRGNNFTRAEILDNMKIKVIYKCLSIKYISRYKYGPQARLC